MRVKIFRFQKAFDGMEREINLFIKGKKIHNIKTYEEGSQIYFLIMYEG